MSYYKYASTTAQYKQSDQYAAVILNIGEGRTAIVKAP